MKRIIRATAVLLALLLLLPAALPVRAAQPDASQKASVTIHKYLVEGGKSLALEQDGREITNPGGKYIYQNDTRTTLKDLKGLNGITFRLTRVQDGAKSENNAKPYTGAGAYSQTLATAQVNGRDGIAKFDNLPHGLYLVEETKAGDYSADTVKFLLLVPMPDPTGSGYLYDIHIYPKNIGDGTRSDKLTKTVDKRTGNEVAWKFTWTIPASIESGRSLVLTDPLDERLIYKSVSVSYENRSGANTILAGKYYDVDYDRSNHTVTIHFEKDSFAELAKALLPEGGRKTPTLQTVVNTTIKPGATGTVKNTGELEYEDDTGKEKPIKPEKDPTVEVEGGTGGICIYKIDGDTKKPLAGAEFRVYQSRTDALAGRNAISGASGTTGSDGYLIIEGLSYEGSSTNYWIVETKAPTADGKAYNLLTSPIEVKVGASSHKTANRVTVENNTGFTVPGPDGGSGSGGGPKANVPDSGGMGRWSFTLAGLLLMGAGGFIAHLAPIRRLERRRHGNTPTDHNGRG